MLSLGRPKCKGVALTSCEAECVSLDLVAQEAVHFQCLLRFICLMTVDTHVRLCGDYQGALAQASNPVAHKRAEHIETRHHFISQLVDDKRFQLFYFTTKNTLADIFTKNLPKPCLQGSFIATLCHSASSIVNSTLASFTTQLFYFTHYKVQVITRTMTTFSFSSTDE